MQIRRWWQTSNTDAAVFGLKSKLMIKNYYRNWKKKRVERAQAKEELLLLPKRVQFYSRFLNAGNLVFDVGANEGNRIQALLELNASIVAVEPQPQCISVLEKKFGDRITIEKIGLGSAAGRATMHVADVSTISTLSKDFIEKTSESRFKRNKWDDTIEIELSTLDILIKKYGIPVFCKIDVEGFEAEVLKGLHSPIQNISFEYCVPEMKDQLLDCIKIIHSLDSNYIFNYSIAESMELANHSWKNLEEFLITVNTDEFTQTLFGDIYCKLK
jgi:FkbM family methyltransferase